MVRAAGDCYMADVNVTGSNEGTSTEPKFSLKRYFEETMPKSLLREVNDMRATKLFSRGSKRGLIATLNTSTTYVDYVRRLR